MDSLMSNEAVAGGAHSSYRLSSIELKQHWTALEYNQLSDILHFQPQTITSPVTTSFSKSQHIHQRQMEKRLEQGANIASGDEDAASSHKMTAYTARSSNYLRHLTSLHPLESSPQNNYLVLPPFNFYPLQSQRGMRSLNSLSHTT